MTVFSSRLSKVLESLNAAQREAVNWQDGSMLILAGPGSGKTQVLTAKVARILQQTPTERFRVLALTFTNKAAGEMLERVRQLNEDDGTDRAFIGTFHAFCIEVLQSHGSELGWSSAFTIYGLPADRQAVLREAAERAGVPGQYEEGRLLGAIDRLRARLILPTDAARHFRDVTQGKTIAAVYAAYNATLKDAQALDFDGLLIETWQLFRNNSLLAERYRKTFRYWLVDEFQDTNRAQYGLLCELGGNIHKNMFAVADDDQIIYRWNGASYQQLQLFQRDFSPTVIQLPTNYRCPYEVVVAANALIRHNKERTPSKTPLVANKNLLGGNPPVIEVLHSITDEEESALIAKRISAFAVNERPQLVVLARTKTLLISAKAALHSLGIKSVIVARRDSFASAAYIWMEAVLRQIVRPLDERNLAIISAAFHRLGGPDLSGEALVDRSIETGKLLLGSWIDAARSTQGELTELVDLTKRVLEKPDEWRTFARECSAKWKSMFPEGVPTDLEEDEIAWGEIVREITLALGARVALDEFMHRLDITSKEPTPPPDAVRLMTIHGAKGKEFKQVFLIGLAEGELPSWQSLKPNAEAELEEERRTCFVAITRTEERLILSYADQYRNWSRRPSRFLTEMNVC